MVEYRIVADVLWAARRYADWTGDTALFDGPGRELLLDTARYWASRARWDDDGLAHIEQGPRRVPRGVDDNAYTNVMARWNLRRAAELAERAGGATPDEIQAWRRLAGALVDGYDPATGRYRQFAGFDELEPLLLGELTRPPSPPTCCSASSGSGRPRWSSRPTCPCSICWSRRRRHLSPGAQPGLLRPPHRPRQLAVPGEHASLLARAGDPERALELLRLACRLDLDNLTGTSAGGLHVATMGGVWQALTTGFLGLRPSGDVLGLDPTCRKPGTRSSYACPTTASACASGPATTSWS